MITIQNAKDLILKNLPKPKEEIRKTYTCIDYRIAENTYANYPNPSFDNSAMDGYAISEKDVDFILQKPENLKSEFEIIGVSQAGNPYTQIIPEGKCIQINTGAKIPENTGAIIPIEDVEILNNNKIKIKKINKKYQNIRRKGEDFKEQELLVKKDTKLNPGILALLLQAGKFEIFVYKKPKILLITTGTELVSFKEDLLEEDIQKGKIIDTNSFLLISLLEKYQLPYYFYGNIIDKEGEIEKIINKHSDVDFIIISGGVSVGPYDFVKKDVQKAGFETIFWKINQKPGKPLFFAKKNHTLVFGLPGNPVSSFVNFQYYVLPAILYVSYGEWYNKKIKLKSLQDISNTSDRDAFYMIKIHKKARFSFNFLYSIF